MITRLDSRRVNAIPARIPRKGVNSSGTGDSESGKNEEKFRKMCWKAERRRHLSTRSGSEVSESVGPVLLTTATKLGIRQERGTRDKPSQ